jgi:hypothetical protein
MEEQKMRTCRKCGKEKPEKDGFQRLGGLFFCCKECCGGEEKKDDQGGGDGKKPNVCEFC